MRWIWTLVYWFRLEFTIMKVLGLAMIAMLVGIVWIIVVLITGNNEEVSIWIYVAGLIAMTIIFLGCGWRYLQYRREAEDAEWRDTPGMSGVEWWDD